MFKLTHVTRRSEKTLVYTSNASGNLEIRGYGDGIRIDATDTAAPADNFYTMELSLDAADRLSILLREAIELKKKNRAA